MTAGKTLAIIPAYNEGANIMAVIDDIRSKAPFLDLLVVNDASSDNTSDVLRRAGISCISLPCNLGIGGAVQTGFKYAHDRSYDYALQIDSDGQHDAGFTEELLGPLFDNRADVVIGSRYLEKDGFRASFFRYIGIKLFSFITSLVIGQRVTDVTSGFRGYNSKALAFLVHEYPVDFPDAEAVILMRYAGLRITEIPVVIRKRASGRSSTGFLKSVYYPVKNMISIFAGMLRKDIIGGHYNNE